MTPKEIAKLIIEDVNDPLPADDRWVGGQLGARLAGTIPTVHKSVVTIYDDTSSNVTDLFNDIVFYTEDHPDGVDRGGVVVIAEKEDERSYYDTTSGAWVETQ